MHLFFAGGEHGYEGEADGLHGERWRPVLGEDAQADMAVAVDVRVHGDVFADEGDLHNRTNVLFIIRRVRTALLMQGLQ